MWNTPRSGPRRYNVAITSVIAALLLNLLLEPLIGKEIPFPLFFAAVTVSAWYGGMGPGVLATILSVLASDYFFLSLSHSLVVTLTHDLVRLAVFSLVALLTSALSAGRQQAEDALRKANEELAMRVEERTQALVSANEALQREILERQQVEEALRESEAKFRTLAETAPYAIFIHQGVKYLYTNPAAQALTGYTQAETLAMNFWDVVHPDFREQVQRSGLARLQGESLPRSYDLKIVTKTGEERWVDLITAVINFQGKPAVLGTAYDITERKHTEEAHAHLLAQEQAARTLAETANRAKDEFLATITHELRTPLTAVLGWVRLLRSQPLDKATTERALEAIERNAKAQTQLIEDLLDISRIIMGQIRLTPRTVELGRVIEAALDTVRPAAQAKDIHVESVLDRGAGPVVGDPDRLQQVVWNLLANAAKFTPKGGRIEVRLRRAVPHVEIRVSDTGQGIKPEFLPHVFERFYQAENARAQGGLGLGLAIVRHLVELHGGTVHAESAGEDQGAAFVVRLPAGPGAPPPEPPA